MTELSGQLEDPRRTRGGHSDPSASPLYFGVAVFGGGPLLWLGLGLGLGQSLGHGHRHPRRHVHRHRHHTYGGPLLRLGLLFRPLGLSQP
ncbi:hypothetical protein HKD37_03G006340 [Glycine soja]